jgi:hypothetical protein
MAGIEVYFKITIRHDDHSFSWAPMTNIVSW